VAKPKPTIAARPPDCPLSTPLGAWLEALVPSVIILTIAAIWFLLNWR
jgi:hypothetical protein